MALDAADGRLLWARHIADTTMGETFTMAPLLFDNLIVIGPAVSEYAIKGWVGAFRLDGGEPVWRFNIVPAPGEPGAETWKQPDGFPLGGGGVWTTPTLDVRSASRSTWPPAIPRQTFRRRFVAATTCTRTRSSR